VVIGGLVVVALGLSIRVVKQYERGVLLRLGRVVGVRGPGLRLIVPVIDVLRRGVAADRHHAHPLPGAHHRRQRQHRGVRGRLLPGRRPGPVGGGDRERGRGDQPARPDDPAQGDRPAHTLDQILTQTDTINQVVGELLDPATTDWGVVVTLVELKDIQLPESMKRAMARQAEAERDKRAKIIAAQGEALAADQLGVAADVMLARPLVLQLQTLQTLVEIGVDKNTMVVVPAPLMSPIQELGAWPGDHGRHRSEAGRARQRPAPRRRPCRTGRGGRRWVNPRPRSSQGGAMKASVRDRIIVKGLHLGQPDRDGEIIAVEGPDGSPPYQVRWVADGHVSLLFPCVDGIVEHHGCIDPTAVR
jgi:Domain of unknown function (DUF1918)/SPFH domain / Band 7 family